MQAWIPLFQTLVWPLVVLGLVLGFREPLRRLLDSIRGRVDAGGEVELAGPAGLKARLAQLPLIEPGKHVATEQEPTWTGQRATVQESSRNVFLAHVISPSDVDGQKYEINTFLVGHRRTRQGYPEDLSDVVRAEFYLGRGWGGRVFDILRSPGRELGFRTHAYGPVLCLCRIHFDDGHSAVVYRYLDFESAVSQKPR